MKRRRTFCEGEPLRESGLRGSEGESEGEGASPAEELLCEKATRVLKHYSLGLQQVPLEELGVSPVNRNLSGPHVHKLGRRIVSVEGLVRFRYQNGCRAESG